MVGFSQCNLPFFLSSLRSGRFSMGEAKLFLLIKTNLIIIFPVICSLCLCLLICALFILFEAVNVHILILPKPLFCVCVCTFCRYVRVALCCFFLGYIGIVFGLHDVFSCCCYFGIFFLFRRNNISTCGLTVKLFIITYGFYVLCKNKTKHTRKNTMP